MSSKAVRVSDLGKRYQLGHLAERPTHFRDLLAGWARAPWKRFRELAGHFASTEDDFWALRHVEFDVHAGEVVGIVGRNGAGKSTLLKILSRITPPTEGYAEVAGRLSSLLEVGTGFHPELTGRENVFLNGAILGMSRADIRRKFDDIVEFAELSQFIDTPVKRYSSGMYVRLAFSVAAHLEPEILVVDEVLSVGDIHFRERCLGRMQSLQGEGRTVLFVSHDLTSIRQLATRALFVADGGIVEDGAPDAVTRRYEQAYRVTEADRNGVAVRNDAPPGFHLRRVELRNGEGETTAGFRAGEIMEIHLFSSGRAPDNSFTVEFKLRNAKQNVVSYGGANPLSSTYYAASDSHFVCRLGPLPLTIGSYSYDFIIRVWNRNYWDMWTEAIRFDILECDPFSTGHSVSSRHDGDFVIQQEWATGE